MFGTKAIAKKEKKMLRLLCFWELGRAKAKGARGRLERRKEMRSDLITVYMKRRNWPSSLALRARSKVF